MVYPVSGNKAFLTWSTSLSTEFRASLASGRENKVLAGGGGGACLLTQFP